MAKVSTGVAIDLLLEHLAVLNHRPDALCELAEICLRNATMMAGDGREDVAQVWASLGYVAVGVAHDQVAPNGLEGVL